MITVLQELRVDNDLIASLFLHDVEFGANGIEPGHLSILDHGLRFSNCQRMLVYPLDSAHRDLVGASLRFRYNW